MNDCCTKNNTLFEKTCESFFIPKHGNCSLCPQQCEHRFECSDTTLSLEIRCLNQDDKLLMINHAALSLTETVNIWLLNEPMCLNDSVSRMIYLSIAINTRPHVSLTSSVLKAGWVPLGLHCEPLAEFLQRAGILCLNLPPSAQVLA